MSLAEEAISAAQANDQGLGGGGEMGARMRALDWARTPVGPPEGWPQSLKTAVRIILGSRYPMFVWWGRELTNFYNDAYVPMLGQRHPDALGRPARQVWADVWEVVGPQTELVLNEGQSTWNEELLLIMERYGYPEETYFTFSYSPVGDEAGGPGGVFCAVTEETARVLGQRRLRTLRELDAAAAAAHSTADACRRVAQALAGNPHDLPFALLYRVDGAGERAELAGATGLEAGTEVSPAAVPLAGEAGGAGFWPLGRVFATGAPERLERLAAGARLPGGPWPEPCDQAVVLPIPAPTGGPPVAFFVAGVSPRRPWDDDYRSFLELVAGQIAGALANARAHEEERRRAEALAELDRAKTAFFSNVSHEFRTPLTLILGPLEDALARSDLPAAQRAPLEVAHRNSLRLLKLVNSLLDFSRIEAGRVQACYEPTDLAHLTAELASVFRSACERAGLALVVDCPPHLLSPGAGTRGDAEPVWVDREMWEKIVLNLLSNAFKFTFEGEIRVSLRPAAGSVELTVADTGTGIPEAELPRLFERFHRVEGARGRTHEGSGIGLALVQELVRLHGGSVRVASAPGAGSRFTVSLPRGHAHLPPDHLFGPRSVASTTVGAGAYVEEALRWLPAAGGPEEPEWLDEGSLPSLDRGAAGAPRPRVLLADDNGDMREYLRRLLVPRYEVEAVADGEAALAAARRQPPDLLLSDIMMPGLDGLTLLAALRADPATRTVPVILLSARAGEESRIEGMAAGADDYLIKPFSARELLARVASHLELARVRREADQHKDEFLAMLAHELRNPLAPISNALQLMRLRGADPAVIARARGILERQVGQLSRLVDDLLDVSRITRGKITLQSQRLDLRTIVARAVESSQPLIDARRHRVHLSLPTEPLELEADPARLEQVLTNLLTNAAKYMEEGGEIWLTAAMEGDQAVLRVRDAGIGIAPELLPHLFGLFAQAERSLDRSEGGLGIGLTLVERLVALHGGTVEARSEGAGRGSEFIIRLPLRAGR